MKPGEVDRREGEHPFVVEEWAKAPESVEGIDEVLEDVQEHDRVRASRRICKLLERLLLQVDPEARTTGLHGPLGRLDAPSAPPGLPGRIEEETDVGADLEEAIPADEVTAHDPEDPFKELAPALLLAQVVLVHDVRVAAQDLVACERRP